MSLWSSIFSAPAIVEKSVDAVIKSGDALVFTEEERSQANLKQLDWILEYHKASVGSNLARRFIAVMTMGVFLLMVLLVSGLYISGLTAIATSVYKIIIDILMVPVGMILAFYFSSGMVRDWAKK